MFVLVSFSVSFSNSGVHVLILTRFPSSWFKTFLLLFVFAFLISNDSLIKMFGSYFLSYLEYLSFEYLGLDHFGRYRTKINAKYKWDYGIRNFNVLEASWGFLFVLNIGYFAFLDSILPYGRKHARSQGNLYLLHDK